MGAAQASEVRYPFAPLLRWLDGTPAQQSRMLGLPLSEVRRLSAEGLTEDEAEEVCTTLAVDRDAVWPPGEPVLPDGFEWADPPPHAGRSARDLTALVAPLIAHPGRWAKVRHFPGHTSANTAAQRIKKGVGVPAGRWDTTGRRVPTGGSDLYVCYLGPVEG